jgi:hypothetical protein
LSLYKLSNSCIFVTLTLIIIFFCVRNKRLTSFQRKFPSIIIKWWMGFVYSAFSLTFTVFWAYFPQATSIVFSIFDFELFRNDFLIKGDLLFFKCFRVLQ